jgi:alkaline phosphatase D
LAQNSVSPACVPRCSKQSVDTQEGEVRNGTLAQYIAVRKDLAAPLPSNVSPEDGAAIGIVGITETQCIQPNVQPGDKIFINGGSGGTGAYGIQIAKALGCHVTTTCSTPKIEFCKSLGADEVIDYTSTDVVKALSAGGPQFKLVVDNIGTPTDLYTKSTAFIAPGGKFVQIGAGMNLSGTIAIAGNMLKPSFLGGGKAKYQMLMAQASKSDLQSLAEWMKEGKVKGVLDSVYEWAKGKIVIKVPVEKE